MEVYTKLKVDLLSEGRKKTTQKQLEKLHCTADPWSTIESAHGRLLWPSVSLAFFSPLSWLLHGTYRKQICGSSLCYAAGTLPVKLDQSPKLFPFQAQKAHSLSSGDLRVRFASQRVPESICLLGFS